MSFGEFGFLAVLDCEVGEIEELLILYWYPLLTVLAVRLTFMSTRTLPGLRGGEFA